MTNTTEVIIIYCSVPDTGTGERIARQLVEYRLAACVTLLPGATSLYRWNDQVETAAEVLLMIKARAINYTRVEAAIRRLHPYELPEIIAVPIIDGLDEYLDWVKKT